MRLERESGVIETRLQDLKTRIGERVQRQISPHQLDAARLDVRQLQEISDQLDHALGLGIDHLDEFQPLGRRDAHAGLPRFGLQIAAQQSGESLDAGERSAQLVGHVGQELALQPVGGRDLFVALAQLGIPIRQLALEFEPRSDVSGDTHDRGAVSRDARRDLECGPAPPRARFELDAAQRAHVHEHVERARDGGE